MYISSPIKFFSSCLALTLMVSLVACGETTTTPTEETTTPETEQVAEEETTEAPEASAEETAAEEEKPENVKEVQNVIQTNLAPELPGTEIEAVSCPADIKLEAEETFDCEVSTTDGSFALGVTMTDDQGNLTFKSKGIVSLVLIEESLTKAVKEQAQVDATVDCGSADSSLYFFKEIGETFECEVTNTASGESQPATITIQSEGGEVNFQM